MIALQIPRRYTCLRPLEIERKAFELALVDAWLVTEWGTRRKAHGPGGVGECLECNAPFEASQRSPDAVMNAHPEPELRARLLALEIDFVRTAERVLVSVPGAASFEPCSSSPSFKRWRRLCCSAFESTIAIGDRQRICKDTQELARSAHWQCLLPVRSASPRDTPCFSRIGPIVQSLSSARFHWHAEEVEL